MTRTLPVALRSCLLLLLAVWSNIVTESMAFQKARWTSNAPRSTIRQPQEWSTANNQKSVHLPPKIDIRSRQGSRVVLENKPRSPILRYDTSLQASLVSGVCGMLPPHVWTCFLPPSLGYFKSEYTVSYGYGLATAWTGLYTVYTTLKSGSSAHSNNVWTTLLLGQAWVIGLYGLRLTLFLFVRNRLSARIRQFNESVETKAQAKPGIAGRHEHPLFYHVDSCITDCVCPFGSPKMSWRRVVLLPIS